MAQIDDLVKRVRAAAASGAVVTKPAGEPAGYFDYRVLFLEEDQHFIAASYRRILGREADEQGLAIYRQVMAHSGKLAVIIPLLFSDERRKRFPHVQYSPMLNICRRALQLAKVLEKRGIKTGIGRLLKGLTRYLEHDFAIIRQIVVSNEVQGRKLRAEVQVASGKQQAIYELKEQQAQLLAQGEWLAGKLAALQSAVLDRQLPTFQPQTAVADSMATQAEEAVLDRYYKAFEDANRGTLAEIRAKQEQYLPFLASLKAAIAGRQAIDIGCGRGEWLQLLAEQHFDAVGVDMNATMVAYCREQQLVAVQQDALQYLALQADDSLALISGFHIIEHLPFAVLYGIVEQAARVLAKGGMVIFETPNPENVLVGSHTFYHDFSHRNPVTPSAISFLFRYHGFSDIHIERLNPYPEDAKVPGHDPLTERVNGHFCGPQDFAIIARK